MEGVPEKWSPSPVKNERALDFKGQSCLNLMSFGREDTMSYAHLWASGPPPAVRSLSPSRVMQSVAQSHQCCDKKVATMLLEALRAALRVVSVVLLFSSKLFELIRVVVIFVVVILVGPSGEASRSVREGLGERSQTCILLCLRLSVSRGSQDAFFSLISICHATLRPHLQFRQLLGFAEPPA